MNKSKLADLSTYVYIDGSNIRFACKKGLGIDLDYKKLHIYLSQKYPNLKRAAYFEGRNSDDAGKLDIFKKYKKYGYEVLSLDRKKYVEPAIFRKFNCKRCSFLNRVKAAPKTTKFKSNVDVYLCSEMMFDAMADKGEKHLILFSCDGDYAEMIKKLCLSSPKIHITVIATPFTKPVNFLSIRLQELRELLTDRSYKLTDISTLRDKIS